MIEGHCIHVSGLGGAFLPGKFADACTDGPIRLFEAGDGARNQVMKFLKNGGAVVLTGAWPAITALLREITKREAELLPSARESRERMLLSRQLRGRILTTLDCVPLDGELVTNAEFPGFVGEQSLPDGLPVLLPVEDAERLLDIPASECMVRAIGASVVAHPDVLVPQSQETIDLVCEAISGCAQDMPDSPRVLDVGCGSGVLCIASWQLLQGRSPVITATDILPEAAATTRLNWRRASAIGKAGPEDVLTTHSGCLFETVPGERFDLIIFNAPWITAPARTRLELALNDDHQETMHAFVESCPAHLNPSGRVIVGYSDTSGPNAIARLEGFFSSAGLTILATRKDRISTRRAKRQWQNIYAYVLNAEL